MSKYFTDNDVLTVYFANFVRHFSAMPSKRYLSRSNFWQSSMEAAKKVVMRKRETQTIERAEQVGKRAELVKLETTKKVPPTVPSKAAQFAPTVIASLVETQSAASFASDDSHNSLPMFFEAVASRSCWNEEKSVLSSS